MTCLHIHCYNEGSSHDYGHIFKEQLFYKTKNVIKQNTYDIVFIYDLPTKFKFIFIHVDISMYVNIKYLYFLFDFELEDY